MKLTSNMYCMAFLVLALLLGTLVPAQTSIAEAPFKVTTVFLVRHAEKQTTPPGDPPLTNNGKARARSLARILSKAGIRAIFTSQFQRTRETARPLAEAMGAVPTVVPIQPDPSDPNKVAEQSIKDVIDRIHQHSGEPVLIVGHTNTIPPVIGMLGGDLIPDIPETEFDNLFLVTVYEKDKAKVVQLKY
jgi:broad specificity phosphatase PhoE